MLNILSSTTSRTLFPIIRKKNQRSAENTADHSDANMYANEQKAERMATNLESEENTKILVAEHRRSGQIPPGAPDLTGQAFEMTIATSWKMLKDQPVNPCFPARIYPINFLLACHAVSDADLLTVFKLFNQRSSAPVADDEGPVKFWNLIDQIGGVPVQHTDPGENAMAEKRNDMLRQMRMQLHSDGRLVCKILIVLELWLFGHPETSPYCTDKEFDDSEEGRVLRWKTILPEKLVLSKPLVLVPPSKPESESSEDSEAGDATLEQSLGQHNISQSNTYDVPAIENDCTPSFKFNTGVELRPDVSSESGYKITNADGDVVKILSNAQSTAVPMDSLESGHVSSFLGSPQSTDYPMMSPSPQLGAASEVHTDLNPDVVLTALKNQRYGRARPRGHIMGELMDLQLTDEELTWYWKLEFSLAVFIKNFRKYEHEFYILVDRNDGDQHVLHDIFTEYGI